ncbi:MAG: thioredoxin [Schlesneria sp.]|jgi:thioredoxin 1|nr:thioredoxin [Schlesneria sp.]
MAGKVLEFTDANFQTEVLSSQDPVLVDFWAPWCGPCKMIAPAIEELANDYSGRVRIGKVNTDDNPGVPTEYRISGIPTVILFKGGREVQRFVGLTQKPKLAQALEGLL